VASPVSKKETARVSLREPFSLFVAFQLAQRQRRHPGIDFGRSHADLPPMMRARGKVPARIHAQIVGNVTPVRARISCLDISRGVPTSSSAAGVLCVGALRIGRCK
jgi:hypothetical protein